MRNVKYNREKIREQYKDLFKYSLDYIYVHDLRGNLLDANEHALEALGYERKEIPDISFLDLLADKEQLGSALNSIQEIRENGKQTKRTEYKITTKRNKRIDIQTYGIPLKEEDDKIYAILGIGTDITAKKKAEFELKESEKRYKNLFEQNPFAIAILNSKGEIIDCNPTAERLTGYKRQSIIGRSFLNISLVQEKDIRTVQKIFKRFISKKKVHRADLQIKRSDGSLIWTHVQGSLFEMQGKKFAQIILYDISQRKAAEQLINKELEKLKVLDEAKNDLITRVSHELKTPLTVINMSIDYLLETMKLKGAEFDDETIETIETLNKGAVRLKRLVENLIDSTKIEYDKFRLTKEKTDLVKNTREVINNFTYISKNEDLEIITHFPESLIIRIDESRIKQVLSNLISNAIKNTPPEGCISIEIKPYENYVEILVKDTGIGLTTEELKQIFKRFGKIERRGEEFESIETQGSGLGLYISKTIVEMHGGEIRAESKGRNKGATFIISLPT